MNLIEGIRFAIAYFSFLVVIWVFNTYIASYSFYEYLIIVISFTAAMFYLAITNRTSNISVTRFIALAIALSLFKLFISNFPSDIIQEALSVMFGIPMIVIELLLTISGVIWASGILEEEQKIESEEVTIPF